MPAPRQAAAADDVPGVYITITEKETGSVHEGILWGGSWPPLVCTFGGESWSVGLRRQRRQLPFTIVLADFVRELYPRTAIPRTFRSDIVKIEHNMSRAATISMNKPFRHRGYTFFQSSWGPADARPGEPLYSVFEVVKNPVERLPVFACSIVTLGLAFHFAGQLFRYLSVESGKRS